MSKLLLRGGRVVDPAQGIDETADLVIDDGLIGSVGSDLDANGADVLDVSGCVVAPGFIDMHVHLREPGLLAHRGTDVTPEDMMLLKVGRHFRLSGEVKVVVGRDEGENAYLQRFIDGRAEVWVDEFPSPLTLLEGEPTAIDLETACRITARYSDGRDEPKVPVRWRIGDNEGQLTVVPIQDDGELEELRI